MILVQKNLNNKIKFIKLNLKKDSLIREWGIIGGKFQTTSNTYRYINKGKINELSPTEVAKDDYKRVIKNKIKEGYVEAESLDNLPPLSLVEKINFDNIQTNFCCSKPTAKISLVKLQELLDSGNSKSFIKYNGLCHYILITSIGEVKIYTRRLDDHTVKYPEIVEFVKNQHYANNSLFIFELIIDPIYNIPHMEAFSLISSISKSNVLKGTPKQDQTKNFKLQKKHRVRGSVFGILYYNSEPIHELSYSEMIKDLDAAFSKEGSGDVIFKPKEVKFDYAEDMLLFIKNNKNKIEGLIIWDSTLSMEITFNGKPKRRGCWKVLSKGNIDVLAVGWNEGTGDRQGLIGSIKLGEYNKNGEIIRIGDCGSGIHDGEECDPTTWDFPCVVAIEFGQRFPTGKLQFPVFLKRHEDKLPVDLINRL